ncbi:ABC transporter substrate-binding protein [Rhodopila sp.]|uniref:ABC transporter substrate-binding protein n=1 Tax=Rhodopila sp. TaxID=2480087 RepID=UPI002C48556F|nr:ABC transporter substrate-binding protein [Rhodopila sp.]HVZ07168.1 ABC transporter substrate-binding protein [Rhodopila sp.]
MRSIPSRLSWLARGAGAAAMLIALHGAAVADGVVKLGILDDLTGPYSLASGIGTVEAVKLAIQDYGGKALGKPVEVVVATDQNKPDIAVAVVREWLDRDNVTAVIGLPNSASALAVSKVVQDADSVALVTASATSDLTGKGCTPNTTHWFMDTYASAKSLTNGLMSQGLKSWFFITVDYNFGLTLQAEASRMITAQGGTVAGSAKHPLGETDFSSALLTAQASKAQVIAMANAAADLDNGIKSSREFHLEQGGQHVAAFFLNISDIVSVGQKELQGAIGVAAVYPGLNPATLTLSHRIADRLPSRSPPTAQNLTAYEAAFHYLQAVDAAGTTEGKAVMAKIKSIPVNDPITRNGSIREDGRFMRDVTVFRVKAPSESKDPFDFLEPVRVIPASDAFRPLSEGGCPFVR